MPVSKKSNVPVHIEFFIENGLWAAKGLKGARIRVQGPTLQAARRRVRRAAVELYGPDIEIHGVLKIPASLQQEIERNKQRRAELREARAELRADTVRILERLRDDLGASYDDAGELLGLDASVLMRTVHSTSRLIVDDDDAE